MLHAKISDHLQYEGRLILVHYIHISVPDVCLNSADKPIWAGAGIMSMRQSALVANVGQDERCIQIESKLGLSNLEQIST